MVWDGFITSIVCITMGELMVATSRGHVLRYQWTGVQNRDYNLDLRRIPFCINQQASKGRHFSIVLGGWPTKRSCMLETVICPRVLRIKCF